MMQCLSAYLNQNFSLDCIFLISYLISWDSICSVEIGVVSPMVGLRIGRQ